MQNDLTGPTENISIPIEFQGSSAGEANADFKGSGTLKIDLSAATYTFSGSPRSLFARAPITRSFHAADISNLTLADRAIRFTHRTPEGNGRPFIFFCHEQQEALSVAQLFPARSDRDFDEARNFAVQLHSLTEHSSPFTSVTNIIVALNVIVFVVMAGFLGAGWLSVDSMLPYVLYGANNGADTTGGEWWRLLTSMFMHYGLLHLCFNMWALYQAGHFLERLQGRVLYALTYLASGLAGGFASILWHGDKTWSAGASGAVFGVYGAVLGYLLHEKQALPKSIYQSLLKSSLMFAGYNLVFGLSAGVDNSAHVGGALGGVAFGWLLALPLDRESRARLARRRLATALLALAVLIAAGVSFTPRFDYRNREEFALDDINQSFAKQYRPLKNREAALLRSLDAFHETPGSIDWLSTELIPFYEQWSAKITGLKLTPGLKSARRRDELAAILNLRLSSYRQLVADLGRQDPQALARFKEANERVMEADRKASEASKDDAHD